MKRSYRDSLIAGSLSSGPSPTLAALRRLRPLIRRYGTKDQKIAYNAAVRAAKGLRFEEARLLGGLG